MKRIMMGLFVAVLSLTAWAEPTVSNVSARQRYPWNLPADYPMLSSTNVTVTMTLVPPPYMVIDLSGGVNASSYPVTYLAAVPAGGWTDEYKTTKLVLRRIEAGTFTMGSPSGEVGHWSGETQHEVTISDPFYAGVFEVTQRQWELVMGNKPSYFSNSSYYAKRPVEQVSYNDIRGSSAGAGWPANNNVDATSFMGKIRAKTNLAGFDLPTEAQWEYACRAGTTTALNSGKNLSSTSSDASMNEVGRYWYNGGSGYSSSSTSANGTAEVGCYLPNGWGLYDMHGNVWEWCLDWYASYVTTAVTNPVGASSGSIRVLRGGSWGNDAYGCRSANRSNGTLGYRDYDYGFRVFAPAGQITGALSDDAFSSMTSSQFALDACVGK